MAGVGEHIDELVRAPFLSSLIPAEAGAVLGDGMTGRPRKACPWRMLYGIAVYGLGGQRSASATGCLTDDKYPMADPLTGLCFDLET